MKKLLSIFGSIGMISGVSPFSQAFAKNQTNLTLTYGDYHVPVNYDQTQRVDAGKGKKKHSVTENNKNLVTPIISISLDAVKKEVNVDQLVDLRFKVDFNGSQVDINDKKINPLTVYDLDYGVKSVNYGDILEGSGGVGTYYEMHIGYAKSQVSADYDEADYYLYASVKDEIVSFYAKMDSHAYNGGNGKKNTAGKGTNRLCLRKIDAIFTLHE